MGWIVFFVLIIFLWIFGGLGNAFIETFPTFSLFIGFLVFILIAAYLFTNSDFMNNRQARQEAENRQQELIEAAAKEQSEIEFKENMLQKFYDTFNYDSISKRNLTAKASIEGYEITINFESYYAGEIDKTTIDLEEIIKGFETEVKESVLPDSSYIDILGASIGYPIGDFKGWESKNLSGQLLENFMVPACVMNSKNGMGNLVFVGPLPISFVLGYLPESKIYRSDKLYLELKKGINLDKEDNFLTRNNNYDESFFTVSDIPLEWVKSCSFNEIISMYPGS